MVRNLRPTDGPDAGQPLRLERWQAGLLRAIDRERKPIVAVRAASQVGKTTLMLGVGLHGAVYGAGTLLASATGDSVRELRRRLDRSLDLSPAIAGHFAAGPRRGPGAATWWDRRTDAGGWVSLAAAGSPAQLASRTARVAVADEVARWPHQVRSGEGHPLQLLRMRLSDWGDKSRLLVISSPTLATDAICNLHASGDRRRVEYPCPDCRAWFAFTWELVTGRDQGETPAVTCPGCGAVHVEAARRRMLRRGRWVATRAARDSDVASYALSRLDSARSTLAQVTAEYRRAVDAGKRGDALAIMAWRNTVMGLPAAGGAADVDQLFEGRGQGAPLTVEQVTAGVDVQLDRLVFVVLGFAAADADAAVLDYGAMLGDPDDDDPWVALTARLTTRVPGRLPVSTVSVDAGFKTSLVRRQCDRRRWWLPTVGRGGEGRPIARRRGQSGICTMGADDAAAWWSGRVAAGRVRLPESITRADVAELCAAEALTIERGRLVWRPLPGRPNHLWDCAKLAIHGRHFRPLAGGPRRRPRLVPV